MKPSVGTSSSPPRSSRLSSSALAVWHLHKEASHCLGVHVLSHLVRVRVRVRVRLRLRLRVRLRLRLRLRLGIRVRVRLRLRLRLRVHVLSHHSLLICGWTEEHFILGPWCGAPPPASGIT